MNNESQERRPLVSSLIEDVPDFPKPGVTFKDITPLLASPTGFQAAVTELVTGAPERIDAVVGMEARGFIFAAPVALKLGAGFVPVRKPGKLPGETLSQDYGLEYGRDRLEIHADALPAGARVIVVDDVLATGGTLNAALALVERQGARIVGTGVLVELGFLEARTGWTHPAPLHACAIY